MPDRPASGVHRLCVPHLYRLWHTCEQGDRMRTVASIVALYQERRNRLAKVHAAGMAVRQVYNGEHPMILPELEKSERAAVANIINSGIEQHAMRVASTVPNIWCPPIKPTKQARDQADDRRLALQAWWHENRIPMKLRRRARHLIGLAQTPVMIRPCPEGYPYWETRDPLTAYPAPTPNDEIVPQDCIFAFKRSRQYLKAKFPTAQLPVASKRGAIGVAFAASTDTAIPTSPDDMFDVLQYIDAEEITLVCVGLSNVDAAITETSPTLLSQQPNLAQRPLVVVPGRITMDRLQGQFDQLIGMYEAQGLLWAYHLHAVKRSIFGETWLEGRPGENPNVITPADPYQGDIGVAEGGVLQQFKTDPGVQTLPALDRLERSQRLTGSVPAEFGGESPTNVRTDRRGLSVMGSAVDFPIQEHQELLAWSLEEENKIAIAVAKAYWGNTSKTFVVPFGRGQVTYTPNVTFDTDMHRVTYAYAGTDSAGLVIEGGQRIGQGTLSKHSFMQIDPMVSDPDTEHAKVIVEAIEQAHLTSIQQQAANPQSPYQPDYLARLTELVYEKNMPLYKAEQQAQKELQAAQAQVQGGMPEQMPGNTVPGAPGTPLSPISPGTPGQMDLRSLLRNLRQPQAGQGAAA